jgi:hypothetical protein
METIRKYGGGAISPGLAATQYFYGSVLALNRFTSVYMPLKHSSVCL